MQNFSGPLFLRVLWISEGMYSWKYRNIHRKTSASESLFHKVAGQTCNFIKKRLQQRCFPMNIAKLLRSPILKSIWKRLFSYVTLMFSSVIFFGFFSRIDNLKGWAFMIFVTATVFVPGAISYCRNYQY